MIVLKLRRQQDGNGAEECMDEEDEQHGVRASISTCDEAVGDVVGVADVEGLAPVPAQDDYRDEIVVWDA